MQKLLFVVALAIFSNCYSYCYSQEPVAVFKAETTNGGFRRLISPPLEVTGSHKVHLVWRNHDSTVKNIFLDKSDLNSIEENTDETECRILSGRDAIAISGAKAGASARIYNMAGILLSSMLITESFHEIPVKKGLYIVQLITNNRAVSEKVMAY